MSLPWQLALGNDTPTTVVTGAGRIQMSGPQFLDIAGGSSGQVLITDGAANLHWGTVSGGSGGSNPPGGSSGQVQINAGGGNFGGVTMSGDATWNTATGALSLASVSANVGTFQGLTVNAKGQVTAAANMSYLTGNQTITLSGDVTGSGQTSIAATVIALQGRTVANLAPADTNVLAWSAANSRWQPAAAATGGGITSITFAGPLTGGTINTGGQTVGLGNVPVGNLNSGTGASASTFWRGDGTWAAASGSTGLSGMTLGQIPIAASATTITSSGNLSGDVTTSGSLATTIAAQAVTHPKMINVSASRLIGNPTGAAASRSEISLGANLSFSGTTLVAAGSVSSVGLSVPATSIFGVTGSPVVGSGTLGLTTTGTVGGVSYFSSTSQLTSSGALTANAVVLGGGATGPVPMASLGTSGYVLTSAGAGAPPTWVAPGGGALPAGGTVGQLLIKNSATAGDAGWNSQGAVLGAPVGGPGAVGTLGLSGSITINRNPAALQAVAGNPGLWVNFNDSTTDAAPNFLLDSYGVAPSILMRTAGGTGASPSATTPVIGVGGLAWRGFYVTGGPAYTTAVGRIALSALDTFTSAAQGTQLQFYTVPQGSPASSLTQQAALGPGLTVGVPTAQASPATGDVNCQRLFVNGAAVGFAESVGWIAGASPNNAIVWINNTGRSVTVTGIVGCTQVVESSGCSVDVWKVPSGTSTITSGTKLNTTNPFLLTETPGTPKTMLTAGTGVTTLAAGDRICVNVASGTPSLSVATITVYMQ